MPKGHVERWMQRGHIVPENEYEDEEANYAVICTNDKIQNTLKMIQSRNFIYCQYLKYLDRTCRAENTSLTKTPLFAKPEKKYYHDPFGDVYGLLGVSSDQAKRATQSHNEFAYFIRKRFNSPL